MTIKLPRPNLIDRFLRVIGKKRGVFIPMKPYEINRQHIYAVGIKESVLKALLRPTGDPLPDGMIDIFECINIPEDINSRLS